ncbi:MAG: TolC family protein, partial [Acinetobacter guillouiae]
QEQFDQLLLTNNNQIKISKLNLNIAKQEVEKEKAVGYPTINFTSKLSRNFDSQDSAFVAKQDGWDYLYGVEMNLPMYNSENQYKIKELYATLNKNKYELDLNIQKQRTQMHEAFYNTLSAISKTNGMKDAELASEKAWLSNKRAYEVGMRVNAEVLEAQSKYYESKQERLTAWYEAWQNYIKLRSILGLLTDNEIID